MKPAVTRFRAPDGGTLTMSVVLYGRDPRTGQTALLPRAGDEIEWTVEWPNGDEVLTQISGPRRLLIDGRTGAIVYPVDTEQAAALADSGAPAPTRIRLVMSDGSACPLAVGDVAFGDPVPMPTNDPVPLESLRVPSISVLPRVEPFLIGLIVSYPLGAADQAVQLAAQKVAELLDGPSLGAALADTPNLDEDSPRVATAAMLQAVARLIVAQAREEAQILAKQIASDTIRNLVASKDFKALFPTEAPDGPGLPFLSKDLLAFTPDT